MGNLKQIVGKHAEQEEKETPSCNGWRTIKVCSLEVPQLTTKSRDEWPLNYVLSLEGRLPEKRKVLIENVPIEVVECCATKFRKLKFMAFVWKEKIPPSLTRMLSAAGHLGNTSTDLVSKWYLLLSCIIVYQHNRVAPPIWVKARVPKFSSVLIIKHLLQSSTRKLDHWRLLPSATRIS